MNTYDDYSPEFESADELLSHLPLDWNEELTLEDYLERMQRQSDTNNLSITN